VKSPWQRSRLTGIGAVVLALLPVGWWLSEHHATVTTFRQASHYHELGHQFGGWSCLGVSRPSVLLRQRRLLPPSDSPEGLKVPDFAFDLGGFTPVAPGPSVTVQSRRGVRHILEGTVANAGWFPGPELKRGDGWWFLFIPYWLIILVFPVLWFCLVLAWQRRKRKSSPS
jgi:hypothetical protein